MQAGLIPALEDTNSTGSPRLVCKTTGRSAISFDWYFQSSLRATVKHYWTSSKSEFLFWEIESCSHVCD
jgi:hypothetical protein